MLSKTLYSVLEDKALNSKHKHNCYFNSLLQISYICMVELSTLKYKRWLDFQAKFWQRNAMSLGLFYCNLLSIMVYYLTRIISSRRAACIIAYNLPLNVGLGLIFCRILRIVNSQDATLYQVNSFAQLQNTMQMYHKLNLPELNLPERKKPIFRSTTDPYVRSFAKDPSCLSFLVATK